MRTTVDLAPGLLRRLRDEAHRRGIPLKHLLSSVVERGLSPQTERPARNPGLPTARLGRIRDGIDLDRALALADSLETDSLLRKLRRP